MSVAWSEAKIARQFPTMVITASVEYISASANRFNRTAAASSSSLIAFGSGKFVALWDTQVGFSSGPCRHLTPLDSHPMTTAYSRPCQDTTDS